MWAPEKPRKKKTFDMNRLQTKKQREWEDRARKAPEKVNWAHASRRSLSEDFIRDCKEWVDWAKISRTQKMSTSFIEEFQDYVNWKTLSLNPFLDETTIVAFQNQLDWAVIGASQQLSLEFVREFEDRLNWEMLSLRMPLSASIIREFQDKFTWDLVAFRPELDCQDEESISLLNEIYQVIAPRISNHSRHVWKRISQHCVLSEEFMCEYANNLDWYYVCLKQKLSDSFIREFVHFINWSTVKISKHLISELIDRVNWRALRRNPRLPFKVLWQYRHRLTRTDVMVDIIRLEQCRRTVQLMSRYPRRQVSETPKIVQEPTKQTGSVSSSGDNDSHW